MYGHLAKLFTTSLIIGGIALNTDAVKEPIGEVLGIFQSAGVMMEMDGASKVIFLDQVAGGDVPSQYELGDFLRANMVTKPGIERDPANDTWGNPYRIESGDTWFRLASAGPDGLHGTDDDLYSGYDLA